jgi:hypothetical protein
VSPERLRALARTYLDLRALPCPTGEERLLRAALSLDIVAELDPDLYAAWRAVVEEVPLIAISATDAPRVPAGG